VSDTAYAVGAVTVVAVTTMAVGAFGLRRASRTSDFYVASRAVSPRWNAAAIGGEYLSAASFLGIAGLVLAYGYDVLWYPVGYTAGYLVLLAVVPVLLSLAALAFVFTWVVAIPAGIYSATHPRSTLDYVLTVLNYVGVATPNFMLALVLMWGAFAYFGVSITGLFSSEFVEAPWSGRRVLDLLAHIWLPAVVLGVAGTARLTRVMRANLLDELHKPYVTTARAKGLPEWRLVMRYPARLALNPLASTIGWYLPLLFSGSLIVATVMNLPNIGPLLLRALINQDMYLAGGILLIYSFLTIVGTLLSDVALALIDPRIRVER